ncbi:Transposon Tf2-8 polyprotein [Vitis vinifera]|uniref:Transposon Tf2-8 polyprotein n=1 Tax=Vitis vinifera TaxID=29760 RepID=A0A438CFK2_VITVI|nr:Transposon Tf2-8 polyprotein [Vitis vinifera]
MKYSLWVRTDHKKHGEFFVVCQRAKASTLSPAGLLQSLPIPCQVWDDITMDFIEGLPPSQGKNTILVVVDRLSKSAHFLALTHPFSAKMVAEKFVDGVVKLHGMPSSIISDRDPIFISNFWREFFKLSGTQLKMSSAYHPQTDGQTEVVNRCVKQYLRCLVHQQPRKWYSLLPWAEFWYNTAYHASTGMSPFQALYGRPPPMIPHYQLGSSPVNEVDQNLASRDDLLHQLKLNLHQASNRMKQIADSKRRDIEFNEGDLVFLRLHPFRQQTVFKRASQKLAHRFYGPFPIEKRIGKVAYQLQLPAGSRIHPVFHVSLLKKTIGDSNARCPTLPPLTDDGALIIEPVEIIDTHATWENAAELHDRFPDLNLEDKVPVKVGGIDKPRRTHRVSQPNQKYLD